MNLITMKVFNETTTKKNLRLMLKFVLLVFPIFILAAVPAQAQISSNFGGVNGGAVIVGESSTTCDSAIEGAMRYSSSNTCVEYCDGTSWICPDSVAGCGAPASCSNVGDLCSDGSLFAGFLFYGDTCKHVFVTDNNQSTSSQWKNATGTNDISTDDPVDGQVNHANRGGAIADFPAFDLCESNTYHGKSDWYLPARAELNMLWLNRAAIDANAAGNFTTSFYWSSTEDNTDYAWYQSFGNSNQGSNIKTGSPLAVRCVRAEMAPAGGCTAPVLCPNIGDVCDDGNGGTVNDPIFVGWRLDANNGNCERFYVTDNNQSTSSQWKTSSGSNDIAADSVEDGRVNDGQVPDSSTFPAFKLCKDLTDGGFNDWYLPSLAELNILLENHAAIDANAAGNFTTSDYWSSTEYNNDYAGVQFVNSGIVVLSTELKTTNRDVRCVRRD